VASVRVLYRDKELIIVHRRRWTMLIWS